MTYSLPLALEDFVPVICASLGYFWILDSLTRGHGEARLLGRVGVLLVTLGGMSKASWKLIIAASDGAHDIVVLDKALFFLLAAGFICLAGALLAMRRRDFRSPLRNTVRCALVVMMVTGVMYVEGMRAYRGALIAVMVLGNTVTLVLAIQACRRRGLNLAALAIGAYLVTGFVLSALSRVDRGEAHQWVLQSVNSAGALGLLLAGRLLRSAPTDQA